MENVGQLIGFAAMAVSTIIYWQRRRKNRLILKLTTDVLWAAHHLMIFSYSAAATTSVAIFREIVFYNYDRKWAKSKLWCVVFSIVFVLASLMTWKDIYSIVPAVSSVLTTIAFGSKKITITRAFAFLASVGMLTYGIHYNSIATVINEFLTELSIIASIIICRSMKRKGEKLC